MSDKSTSGEKNVNAQGYGPIDKPRVEAAVRELLLAIGEDPDREGLLGTPDRVARACEEDRSAARRRTRGRTCAASSTSRETRRW